MKDPKNETITLNDMVDNDHAQGKYAKAVSDAAHNSGDLFEQLKNITEKLQKEHPEAWELIEDKAKRDAFIETLTIKDFERCYPDEDIPNAIRDAFTTGTSKEKINAFGSLTPKVLFYLYEHRDKKNDSIITTTGKRVSKVDFPIDKVNNNIWNLLELEADSSGQLSFAFNVAKSGSEKPLLIFYSINFNEIEGVSITKQLTPFDKRVYLAVAALYNQGNIVMSYSQIYAAMGNHSRPSPTSIRKIEESISKMGAAWITLNNEAETEKYKKRKLVQYDTALLPFERKRSVINGKLVENAIHLFREPPLVAFARERKQLTTFDLKVLDTPISHTDQTIMIEDYLLDAITNIKSGRRNSKILLSTLYEATKIKTKKQRARAPEKIKIILSHYKACGQIHDFEMTNDGISIYLQPQIAGKYSQED